MKRRRFGEVLHVEAVRVVAEQQLLGSPPFIMILT